MERSQTVIIDNHPTKSLKKLLQLSGITAEVQTLQDAVNETQKNWLRKPSQERWHIEEQFETQRGKFIPLFKQLGIMQEVRPTKKHYKYAVLLGATIYRTRTRLAYLIDIYNSGVTFDHIIILGGQRPLDPSIERTQDLVQITDSNLSLRKGWTQPDVLPTNENEMMQFIFDQTELPFDRNIITFVDTPMQRTKDGSIRRPNTGDTFATWLTQKPSPGSCLVISNQPYVSYQDTVARTYLPLRFNVETVGESAPDSMKISVTLDNIARWLYQLKQFNSIRR